MANKGSQSIIQDTEQIVLNNSVDPDFKVLVVEQVRRNAGETAVEFFNPATEETLQAVLDASGGGVLATQIDDVSTANVTYIGKAAVGSATSSAVWSIQKLDESGTPITLTVKWADGGAYSQVWDNRTSLTYL